MLTKLKKLVEIEETRDKKLLYTFYISLIVGLSAVLIFTLIVLAYFLNFVEFTSISINEYRLLIVPFISLLVLFLIKLKKYTLSKIVLIFAPVFVFSYFTVFWGRPTEEILFLNPTILITFSAISFFILRFTDERLYLIIVNIVIYLLILFYDYVFEFSSLEVRLVVITGEDYFNIKLAQLMALIVIDSIVYYSVSLYERILSQLDENNRQIEESRLKLLNQNLKLKQVQNEIYNKNTDLFNALEELKANNEQLMRTESDILWSQTYTQKIKKLLKNDKEFVYKYLADFYFFEKTSSINSTDVFWTQKKADFIYFAIADIDKKFVPSPLLSVLIIKQLNYLIEKHNSPTDLYRSLISELNLLHHSIELKLDLNSILNLSLIAIEQSSGKIQFFGNTSNIVIIRNKKIINTALVEQLLENDLLYCFTDGFYQQKEKDYQGALHIDRFRSILLSLSEISFSLQKEKLDHFLKDWIGNRSLSDDITLVGLRIR
ncbi:MAG: hypothetical protein JXR60_08725 [Bacteroidales bacterium]|nr:hypothetical protein [Bacteroidales bacterium]